MGKIVVAKIVLDKRQSHFYRYGIIRTGWENDIAGGENKVTRGNDKNVTLDKINNEKNNFLALLNKAKKFIGIFTKLLKI